jgi:CheY-like chemotaxis protein
MAETPGVQGSKDGTASQGPKKSFATNAASRENELCGYFASGGAQVAKILVAASSEPRAILARMLARHELSCAETLEQAEQLLRERKFDLIVCTVYFDESRMFDLLRLAKETPQWQHIPFVCARLRPHVLESPIALQGVAFTCKALGAAAFLNITDYRVDPEGEMRIAIDRLLGTACRGSD